VLKLIVHKSDGVLNALLITGTSTEAGKTVLTMALAAYWQTYHYRSLGIMKPIQAGRGDRELYNQLFSLQQSMEEITPLYFEAPLAPPLAAAREGRRVELELVWQAFENLRSSRDWVLVEALGGLGSPVSEEFTVADLAAEWRLPTVLVVPVNLGAITQAAANVALARLSRVHLKGIVLNCVQPRSEQEIADWAPVELIQSLTNTPVLGCLPHLKNSTDLAKLAQVASDLDLERLIPL
jgi:dethiobiotin synthetase